MDRKTFADLTKKGTVILDGSTGTEMIRRGMPKNACSEAWILDHPDLLIALQQEYRKAGSQIVYAPTFSANRISLEKHGLQNDVERLNTGLVETSRKAVGNDVYVAGDLTTTGELLEPVGELEEEELFEAYREQVSALYRAGVDLFIAETLMSVQEAEIALKACRDVAPELPFLATLTVTENGRSFFGGTAKELTEKMTELQADAAGINCSVGPDLLKPVVKEMAEASGIPVIVKPNAGQPIPAADGSVTYPMDADEFFGNMQELVSLGANVIGGCCGTTPAYIAKLAERYR